VNHAEHEDVAQKQEDWRAVKAYQAAQRAAERTSLAGRIAEAHRQKELDLERHRQAMDALHMDLELRRLDHLEMREFREEERVRSRRSIALRLASWKDDKLARERERAKELLVLQEQANQCAPSPPRGTRASPGGPGGQAGAGSDGAPGAAD
jgi:hypothetical protein